MRLSAFLPISAGELNPSSAQHYVILLFPPFSVLQRSGPVDHRGCASSGEAPRHAYTTAVIAPHITKLKASHK